MDLIITVILLAAGLSFIVIALVPVKFNVGKDLQHLSERNKGIGIAHGMVRRSDGNGVVPIRSLLHTEKKKLGFSAEGATNIQR